MRQPAEKPMRSELIVNCAEAPLTPKPAATSDSDGTYKSFDRGPSAAMAPRNGIRIVNVAVWDATGSSGWFVKTRLSCGIAARRRSYRHHGDRATHGESRNRRVKEHFSGRAFGRSGDGDEGANLEPALTGVAKGLLVAVGDQLVAAGVHEFIEKRTGPRCVA